jgi:hypothetical protein
MLHSFYTQIERIATFIAREWDGNLPSGDAWHRDLLKQTAVQTDSRPRVFEAGLVETLGEFLAFRHLFRGASIVRMRWDKLAPLVAKLDDVYIRVKASFEEFRMFLNRRA